MYYYKSLATFHGLNFCCIGRWLYILWISMQISMHTLVDLINIAWCFILVYMEVKFCSYNPSSNLNFYLWNGILPISATTSQPSCKVVTTLQRCKHLAQIATTLWQPCYNLTKLQQGCYNLAISVRDVKFWHLCFKL